MRITSWAFGLLLSASAGLAAAAGYELTDLGPAKPNGISQALGLNQAGDAVGFAIVDFQNYTRQARLFHAGKSIQLAARAGVEVFASTAVGITDDGLIAGTATIAGQGFDKPFLYRNGELTVLIPPERGFDFATALNNPGELVGQSWTAEGDCLCGFLWRDGVWQALRSPAEGFGSLPLAINDAGAAVGWADLEVGRHAHRVAMRWQGGEMQVLPDLGGRLHEAHGINAQGDIVGTSQLRAGKLGAHTSHAFVYRQGQLIDLDKDPQSYSVAHAINASGQVVGERRQPHRDGAFVTDAQGRMRYLTTQLSPEQQATWVVAYASAINDQGVIVGTAFNRAQSTWRAVKLTPRHPSLTRR